MQVTPPEPPLPPPPAPVPGPQRDSPRHYYSLFCSLFYSLFVWLTWGAAFGLFGLPAILLTTLSPDRGFRFVRWAALGTLSLVGMPVILRGAERVDWRRAYVVMGNHQSMIDPFAMLAAFPTRPIAVEKVELQRIPVYGWLSRAWGNIPIRREDHASAMAGIALARERLVQGLHIGIMPEGTRTKDGRLGPFKKGGFLLAIDAGASILPFTINGSFERFSHGPGHARWRLHKGPIEVTLSEPVSTEGYGREGVDELVERVRGLVAAALRHPGALVPPLSGEG